MTKILIDRSTVEQALEACPFCGNEPSFSGDASEWKDESRYVELSLGCCVSMTEQIGWRRARDMTHEAKTAELCDRLRSKWNTRAALAEPQEPVAWMYEDTLPKEYPYDAMWPHSAVRDGVRMFPVFAPPQRPAEPQEPVAWMYTGIKQDDTEHGPHLVWKAAYMDAMSASKGAKATPLYTHPPQRKPLSAVDLRALYDRHAAYQEEGPEISGWWDFARAIERAHKIGEGT